MRLSVFNAQRWAESFRHLVAAWKAFWFTPADPLVLGVQRIACGLVLTYLALATTPLLPLLYAPDGLVDDRTANLVRLEQPVILPPDGWEPAPGAPAPAGDRPAPGRPPKPPPVLRPERLHDRPYFDRWGVDAAHAYDQGAAQFSPFFHIHDPRWALAGHGLGLAVAVLFTLGLGTRVVSVLAWFFGLSYMHRAMFALFGFDTMLAIALFYLMLGPAGARLSLDRLIQRHRRWRFAVRHPGSVVPMEVAPGVAANVVLRLFQIHFCIIYLNSGLSKLQGAAWWNGTALWQTLANYEFTPERFRFYTDALRWLCQRDWLWELAMTPGDVFTLALEIGLPFLIWQPRLRPLLVVGAVALHTGIALSMGMTSFSLMMLVLLAAFVPAEGFRRLLDRLLRGSRTFTLRVSARDGVGVRLAALVKAIDLHDQVRAFDAAERPGAAEGGAPPDAPELVDATGKAHRGYAVLERLSRSLPLLWPIGLLTWVPGAGRLGRALAPGHRRDRHPEAAGARP